MISKPISKELYKLLENLPEDIYNEIMKYIGIDKDVKNEIVPLRRIFMISTDIFIFTKSHFRGNQTFGINCCPKCGNFNSANFYKSKHNLFFIGNIEINSKKRSFLYRFFSKKYYLLNNVKKYIKKIRCNCEDKIKILCDYFLYSLNQKDINITL